MRSQRSLKVSHTQRIHLKHRKVFGKFLREISVPFTHCENNFQMVQVNIYMFSRL